MAQFEYRVIEQPVAMPVPTEFVPSIAAFLAAQDLTGWELVSVTPRPVEPADSVHGLLYFFKRPVPTVA